MSFSNRLYTDCHAATVGSILGMRDGVDTVDAVWQKPVGNTLHTTLYGIGTVRISDCVKKTMEHIRY